MNHHTTTTTSTSPGAARPDRHRFDVTDADTPLFTTPTDADSDTIAAVLHGLRAVRDE